MQVLSAAIAYFMLTFGAGFVLGTVRVLWVVPRLGTRIAELMEAPIMLAVTIFAARWVARRFLLPFRTTSRLGMGFIALSFLLAAEFGVGLWVRGITIREYFAGFDPISGTVYFLLLGIFAVMPLLVARK